MNAETEIVIVCSRPSARLHYVAGFLTDATGIRFAVSGKSGAPIRILYDPDQAPGEFQIFDSGFLQRKGTEPFTPAINKEGGIFLFPSPPGFDIPFDFFSAVFFLISRYEEYQSHATDLHGRFEPQSSFQFKNNFLHFPIVDEWIVLLKKQLGLKYPQLHFPLRGYRFISTIDIDSPWAFKYRTAGGNLAGLVMNLIKGNFSNAAYRSKVMSGRMPDPFDVYTYIRSMEEEFGFSSLFFFLLRLNGRYDLNHSVGSKKFCELVSDLARERRIGIHPSYASNSGIALLEEEFRKFEEITGKYPVRSRQHFLMLKFPETYRRLISLGITDDYSMGYASLPGFRAGTTLPFNFYDLEREQITSLKIHPFTVMDVTLQQYLKKSPEDAVKTVSDLISKTRAAEGVFTLLWHNESLSEFAQWKGWRRVFREIIQEATLSPVSKE